MDHSTVYRQRNVLKIQKTERCNIFYKTLHSETLRWDSSVSRKVVWGEEFLQVDEGLVHGEEDQVVSPHFIIVSLLNLAPRLELKLSGLHREKMPLTLTFNILAASTYSLSIQPSLPPQAAWATSPTTCISGNVFNMQQLMRLHTLKRQGEAEGS